MFFKAKTSGSSAKDVGQSLKFYGQLKAKGEPPREGASNGAQGKKRNPSQSPKHDDTSANHMKRDNSTQTNCVAAETQQSGPSAGEIGKKNATSETARSFTQEETHSLNQVATQSSSPQFQTSSSSVKQSSGNDNNVVDSNSPGPQ